MNRIAIGPSGGAKVSSGQTGSQALQAVARNGNGAAVSSGNGSKPPVSLHLTVRLTLPRELYTWAAAIAETLDQSLAEFVRRAVVREVDRHIRRGGADYVATLEALSSTRRPTEGNGSGA